MNMRSWTWLDDSGLSEEQADALEPTLNALASEWSSIQNEIEQEGFRRQAQYEDGGGPEEPECEHCDRGYIGYQSPNSHAFRFFCCKCHQYKPDAGLVLLLCPWCNGEGVDRKLMAEEAKTERQIAANREVRLEIIEGMLERYGARMMRPYEHWHEDERYMQYMESDRFGGDY